VTGAIVRKRDPNRVISDFDALLDESLDTLRFLLDTKPLARHVDVLCEDAFLRAAVGWEGFRSDWHLAAINRDSGELAKVLSEKVRLGIRPEALAKYVRVELPKHPTLEEISRLVDPDGRNVDFREGWKKRARKELTNKYAKTVLELHDADLKLVSAVESIRNCIAHRSDHSSSGMNTSLSELNTSVDGALCRRVNRVQRSGIGGYLAAVRNGSRRIEVYHNRLREIAWKLAVA
jgi:hypothetical protein